jgi:small subunit ribosomal protein S17
MTNEPTTADAAGARRRVAQQGTVTSVAGTQSVVVQVDRRVVHPRYHKYISKRTKFMAHDERGECAVGDVVEIVSCRPLSARKRWRVRSVVERASQAPALPADMEA